MKNLEHRAGVNTKCVHSKRILKQCLEFHAQRQVTVIINIAHMERAWPVYRAHISSFLCMCPQACTPIYKLEVKHELADTWQERRRQS